MAAAADQDALREHDVALPPRLLGRMVGNLAIEAAVGAIPLVGDAADFFLKANQRNMRLIHEHPRLAPAT